MIGALFARLFLTGQLALDTSSLTLPGNPSEAMLQNGRYFQYVRTIEEELTRSPSDPGLHASLALGYCLLGQRRFCDEEIQAALALVDKPDAKSIGASAQVHYVAGRLDMENTKFKDAASHFEAALLVEPNNTKIEYFLGVCLQALNRREGARIHFEHACSAASYSWPCRALAQIELDDKNAAAARMSAEQAVRIEPTSAEAQLVAGKAAEALGDTPAAVSFFQKAAELDPSWEAPHYRLGHLYEKMPGKNAAAAHEMARFQELSNDGQ
jgi:tetratricopeptide (TPR) repeat protein